MTEFFFGGMRTEVPTQQSHYYQAGETIRRSEAATDPMMWRTADLKNIDKNSCMNLEGNRHIKQKAGTVQMGKDDNEAMFIPMGYAIIGYDHDHCTTGGRGAALFHPFHKSMSSAKADQRIKSIVGGAPGGTYNYMDKDGLGPSDQPRELAKKMASWKVFELNSETGLRAFFRALKDEKEDLVGSQGGLNEVKKNACRFVDKANFGGGRDAWVQACEDILSEAEREAAWPDPYIGVEEERIRKEEEEEERIRKEEEEEERRREESDDEESKDGDGDGDGDGESDDGDGDGEDEEEKSNTMLYVGLGALILLLLIGGIMVVMNKKP
jgi:hypothetical protein